MTSQETHPYDDYQLDPTPEKLSKVVDYLKPTIDFSLNSNQSSDDPYIRSRARTIAGSAVKTFDPSKGAGLQTWVTQQLQQVHRVRRQSQGPIKLPDRALLDNMAITRAEREFLDQHGRDPDLTELSDFAKIPVKRIGDVRRIIRKMPSVNALGGAELPGQEQEDPYMDEALSYVYGDADYLDRKIIEMKTGYGGGDVMDPVTIAQKLRLHPSMLSRRSARLALKIHDTHANLQEVHG